MVELECYTCGFKTRFKKDLTTHLEEKHIETRTCETCKRVFQTIKGYKCHRRLRTCLEKQKQQENTVPLVVPTPPVITESEIVPIIKEDVVQEESQPLVESEGEELFLPLPPSVPRKSSWTSIILPYFTFAGTCMFIYSFFRLRRH